MAAVTPMLATWTAGAAPELIDSDDASFFRDSRRTYRLKAVEVVVVSHRDGRAFAVRSLTPDDVSKFTWEEFARDMFELSEKAAAGPKPRRRCIFQRLFDRPGRGARNVTSEPRERLRYAPE